MHECISAFLNMFLGSLPLFLSSSWMLYMSLVCVCRSWVCITGNYTQLSVVSLSLSISAGVCMVLVLLLFLGFLFVSVVAVRGSSVKYMAQHLQGVFHILHNVTNSCSACSITTCIFCISLASIPCAAHIFL